MRTLLGWELGDNLGHLMRLLPLARALRGRGDEVVWAMSGGRRSALDRIGAEGFLAVPVPDWDCVDPALPWSQTYGQNLLRNGYRLPHRLAAQLEAWRVLIADQKPDLLIAEHAPTALLAARRAGLPRLALGTGFSLPPRSRPMPGLPPWFTFPQDLLVRHEESFLERLNLPFLKEGDSHGSRRRFLLRRPPNGMAPQAATGVPSAVPLARIS